MGELYGVSLGPIPLVPAVGMSVDEPTVRFELLDASGFGGSSPSSRFGAVDPRAVHQITSTIHCQLRSFGVQTQHKSTTMQILEGFNGANQVVGVVPGQKQKAYTSMPDLFQTFVPSRTLCHFHLQDVRGSVQYV